MTKRLLFLLISLGFFGFTIAQEDAGSASEEVVELSADDDEAEPEEVVVTGSRIARSQYEVSQPIQIIYGEEYENRGYTNAADALFDLPGVGVSNSLTSGTGGNGFGNQSQLSVGQAIANNFGLGSGRTLVLVNGKRYVSSAAPFGTPQGGGAVDLNNIPSIMIERVEVVNAGGSAVYGSDAIAGVINYILKDDFEGANATLLYDDYAGLSSDLSFQFALGGNFAGGAGNVVLNFQYDEVGTVFTGDVPRLYNRKTGRCGDLFRANAYNPDAAYQSQYIGFGSEVPYAVRNGSFNGRTKIDKTGCITLSTLPETGRATPYETALSATFATNPFYGIWPDGNHYHFVGSGDLGVYDVGIPYGNAFFAFESDDGFRGDYNTYRAGFERLNFSIFSTYDITDSVRMYLDVYKNGFYASDFGNQSGYPYSTYVFAPGQDTPIYIGIDNPYLTANSRNIMAANGLDAMYVSKSHVDLLEKGDGGYTIENTNDLEFFSMGLEGDFALNDGEFLWSAGYSYGATNIQADAPAVLGARYAAALDVGINPTTGEIDCKMNYDPDYDPSNYYYYYGPPTPLFGDRLYGGSVLGEAGQCRPLNVMGRGAPSQEARDYIGVNVRTQGLIEQEVTFANLSGQVYELPAGSVGMAIGWEGRTERGDYLSSPIDYLSGSAPNSLTRGSFVGDLGGTYEVDATYYEVSIPLLGGSLTLPFVDSLVLDFSGRNIDNNLAGTYDVDATSLSWRISDDISIRASEQTAVKAPDIGQLFQPQLTSYAFARPDPCDFRYRGTGRAPDVRERNCLAEGLAPDFVSQAVNASVQGLSGGNPNLENELAETESIGLIYQPSWFADVLVGDLSFSADYIKINLDDYITSFTLGQNLIACYDFEDYPNRYCDNFRRDADGQIVYWEAGLVNAGLIEFATYVWNADYLVDASELVSFVSRNNVATDLGSIAVRWRAYQQVYFKNAASGDPNDLEDTTGEFGNDEWFYDTTVEYRYNDFYAYLVGNSRSGGKINVFQQYDDQYLDLDGNPISEFKGYTFWNAGFGYQVNDGLSLRLIFNNVMDYDGTEDVFTREADIVSVGRTVTAGFNWRF